MSDEQLPATRELAKVANNLINKLAKGGWTLYEPTHTRRMARAEADAKVTLALGDQQATDIQLRAAQRWMKEEERNQQNVEAVVKGAIPGLREDAKPEKLDDDWLTGFFDYAKKVSDEEMQSLWSRILAGEANAPGSFKKRVLQTVSLLDKEDAELFTKLCRFTMDLLGVAAPVIFDIGKGPYAKLNLFFQDFVHLEAFGLIRFDNLQGFARQEAPPNFQIRYGSKRYNVEMKDNRTELPIGRVIFTDVGVRLARLSNAQVVPEFEAYFIEEWKKQGIIVTPA